MGIPDHQPHKVTKRKGTRHMAIQTREHFLPCALRRVPCTFPHLSPKTKIVSLRRFLSRITNNFPPRSPCALRHALCLLILVSLLLFWLLANITDPPLSGIFGYLALHNKHFLPFMKGIVNTRDIVYYLTMTYFFLLLTTRMVEARRWR